MESRNVTQTAKRARGKCSNGKSKRYSHRKEGKRQVFKWKYETLLTPQRGQEASVQMESRNVTQTAKRARGKCSNGNTKRYSDRKEGKRQVFKWKYETLLTPQRGQEASVQMESRNVTRTAKRARGKCSNGNTKRYSHRKEGKRQVFKWKVAPVFS